MGDGSTADAHTVSETLCQWLAGLDPAHIPGGVQDAVIDTVIDVAGLAVAARKTDCQSQPKIAHFCQSKIAHFGLGFVPPDAVLGVSDLM